MLNHAVLLEAVPVGSHRRQALVQQCVPPVPAVDLARGALCRAALGGVVSAADVSELVPRRHVGEVGRVVGGPLVLFSRRWIVAPAGPGGRRRGRSRSQVAYLEDPVLPQHADFRAGEKRQLGAPMGGVD